MTALHQPRGEASIGLIRVGMVYRTAGGPVEALRDISLDVGRGEFVSLVGPSGCGKSTLLRIVAGLRPATSGSVSVDGAPVMAPLSNIGMVFQAPVLLKWRTVLDNVLLPAELAGLGTASYRQRAIELLQLVGLGEFAGKRPHELSGGMQQRASICRALLLDPPLLLMDEPFGALDAMTRDDMNIELLRIWGEDKGLGRARKTILFVTHSIPEAVILSDRVVVMSRRPGTIAAVAAIDLPRPRSVETRASEDFGRLSLAIYRALNRGEPACAEANRTRASEFAGASRGT
ncbi:MAG: ABC transporter ATP-binding protein [Hyphomicrobiaceae bacterium]|nr:ABC transporter ATP-binding protein [Hyphomicrobiaceae bacterium]